MFETAGQASNTKAELLLAVDYMGNSVRSYAHDKERFDDEIREAWAYEKGSINARYKDYCKAFDKEIEMVSKDLTPA